jgi:hypothetical protein
MSAVLFFVVVFHALLTAFFFLRNVVFVSHHMMMEQSYLLYLATIISTGCVLPNGFACMRLVRFASTTFSKAVKVHNQLMLTQLTQTKAWVHEHLTCRSSK